MPRYILVRLHERAHTRALRAGMRVCDMRRVYMYTGAHLLSLHTFRRGDERNRGGCGVVSTPFPFHSRFCPLSLTRSLFPSLPFLVLTFSLSISIVPFLSLYVCFPVCSSTVCCFTHTLTYVYPLYSRAHTHTRTVPHTCVRVRHTHAVRVSSGLYISELRA